MMDNIRLKFEPKAVCDLSGSTVIFVVGFYCRLAAECVGRFSSMYSCLALFRNFNMHGKVNDLNATSQSSPLRFSPIN